MYRWFLYLNIASNIFEANLRHAADEKIYEAHFKNTAKITYADQAFIKTHVLKRGYTADFRNELLHRWEQISLEENPRQ